MAGAGAIPSLLEMLPVAEIERSRERERQREGKKEMTWLPLFLPSHLQTVPEASQKPVDRESGKCRKQRPASRGKERRGMGVTANSPS